MYSSSYYGYVLGKSVMTRKKKAYQRSAEQNMQHAATSTKELH